MAATMKNDIITYLGAEVVTVYAPKQSLILIAVQKVLLLLSRLLHLSATDLSPKY